MDVELLDVAFKAIVTLSDPTRLSFLGLGVIIGLILGVIPGLGGLVGLSLLLPFTFKMDPYTALAFLMGLQAVVVTSDTIPAVLFGVPGTVGSAATILDGYPMARKGQAGRAFGAAFSASVLGGLFGAAVLALSVPVIRPIILEITSPELLAICVFGLSLVAVLSGSTPLKGLAAACIGLLVATAGDDPQTGTLRWTFDSLYLYDGLPVVPLALGLFAIPEIADMVITRQSIAGTGNVATRWSQIEGIKDVFRNKFLLIRCATIGSSLGAIPGIGASIIDWIAYGHAVRSIKDSGLTFGKGDVRGVIASESSNNAKEGGALLPTIAFGVPGSASMALILGAFLIHGLEPGPKMLTQRLDITYTLVWSVAVANILGAGLCFLFANQLAKIALVRIGILAPVVLAVTYIGAYQGSNAWGDIYALLIFGFVGWIMKRLRWPRPPLILGFVLGGLVERYLFISTDRYGWEWLWIYREGEFTPWVTIIFALTLYDVLRPIIKGYLERRKGERRRIQIAFQRQNLDPSTWFSFAVLAMFVACIWLSSSWEFGARLAPQVISIVGILFTGGLIFADLFVAPAEKAAASQHRHDTVEDARQSRASEAFRAGQEDVHFDIQADYGDLDLKTIVIRAARYFGWLVFFFAAAAAIGLLPAMFVFLVGYMRYEGKESWKTTLLIAVPMGVFSYFLFHRILLVQWPLTLFGDLFPVVRSIEWLNLF
ncbi:MAG: tripartite tricarboxylate transporter permease [Alphaproteobacteria bacterium]|nr:tripartite tricarboxylate transporter permease [Alphaproteobacteria bacterium]